MPAPVAPTASGYYVRLSREGLFAGAGLYMPDRDRLARVRAAIADDTSGAELEVILAGLSAAGFELLTDGGLKTAPHGYPADHPRIDLLRLPHLAAGTEFPPRKWLHTPAAEGRIVAALARPGPTARLAGRHRLRAVSPACMPKREVGIFRSGVVAFAPIDERNRDAVAYETLHQRRPSTGG